MGTHSGPLGRREQHGALTLLELSTGGPFDLQQPAAAVEGCGQRRLGAQRALPTEVRQHQTQLISVKPCRWLTNLDLQVPIEAIGQLVSEVVRRSNALARELLQAINQPNACC